MAIKREVNEGLQYQGTDEEIAYDITIPSSWGVPASVTFKAYDITDGARVDVTATVLSGLGSILGSVITTPLVKALTVDRIYRVESLFPSAGNKFEPYFIIKAEY